MCLFGSHAVQRYRCCVLPCLPYGYKEIISNLINKILFQVFKPHPLPGRTTWNLLATGLVFEGKHFNDSHAGDYYCRIEIDGGFTVPSRIACYLKQKIDTSFMIHAESHQLKLWRLAVVLEISTRSGQHNLRKKWSLLKLHFNLLHLHILHTSFPFYCKHQPRSLWFKCEPVGIYIDITAWCPHLRWWFWR